MLICRVPVFATACQSK